MDQNPKSENTFRRFSRCLLEEGLPVFRHGSLATDRTHAHPYHLSSYVFDAKKNFIDQQHELNIVSEHDFLHFRIS